MAGTVIQGFFVDGVLHMPATAKERSHPHLHAAGNRRLPDSSGGAPVLQCRVTAGPPRAAYQSQPVASRESGARIVAIDPHRIGLADRGGRPLPTALQAKMEAAFRTDFSAVRIHVGPQPSRIGALAFTTGNDVYFAPGQYQPDRVTGQQLIGHELTHVVQQREGRVRSPAVGMAIVQDTALEAEADRMGMRAAALRAPIQRKVPATVGAGRSPDRAGALPAHHRTASTRSARSIQRMEFDDDEARAFAPLNALLAVASAEFATLPGADVQVRLVQWLRANDPASQPSNFSIGLTATGAFIVSKVGGLTTASAIVRPFVAFIKASGWGNRNFYLASKFNNSAGSGNHAEMCVVAAAHGNGAVGALTSVICTHPNCALCAEQMRGMGIAGSSIDNGAPGSQATWAHPTRGALFGTVYGETDMAAQVRALTALNTSNTTPPQACGRDNTSAPTTGLANALNTA